MAKACLFVFVEGGEGRGSGSAEIMSWNSQRRS
jgi:hypothetical protein